MMFETSEDVRKMSLELGGYYFSPDTMRFFDSRLLAGFWPSNEDSSEGFVVVSNKDNGGLHSPPQPREYVVVGVTWMDSGKLDLMSLVTFPTAAKARAEAKRLSEEALGKVKS